MHAGISELLNSNLKAKAKVKALAAELQPGRIKADDVAESLASVSDVDRGTLTKELSSDVGGLTEEAPLHQQPSQ